MPWIVSSLSRQGQCVAISERTLVGKDHDVSLHLLTRLDRVRVASCGERNKIMCEEIVQHLIPEAISGPLQCYPVRLHPGQEIYSTLVDFVRANGLTSAFVLTCVGSVTRAHLRMANAEVTKHYEGPFEIVSLVGSLSGGEMGHLHISLSDEHGDVIGGHVMGDLIVYTTAEIVIGSCSGVTFTRLEDPETGYDELVVERSTAER